MITQLVIRPSGVWNSRAPFSNYYADNREIGIHFNVLVVAASRVRADVLQRGKEKNDGSALRWLRNAGATSSFAWLGYRKSLGRDVDGALPRPTPSDLAQDLRDAVNSLCQMMLLRVSSLYEAFAQCWALNYLLTRLEHPPHEWSPKEQMLADRLSPVLSGRVPGWPAVLKAIPWIGVELSALPHIYIDMHTKEEVSAPVTDFVNALSVIEFWREYRNLVIHRNGLVSTEFFTRFGRLYEELRKPFRADIPPLKLRTPLKFSPAVPKAMATVHYRAAAHLAKRLVELSHGRRGHAGAPGPDTELLSQPPKRANPLLMEGDHAASLEWVNMAKNERFIRSMIEHLQREGRERGLKRLPLLPAASVDTSSG